MKTMDNKEALKVALAAVRYAYEESDHFNGGDYASHEIMRAIERALREAFK